MKVKFYLLYVFLSLCTFAFSQDVTLTDLSKTKNDTIKANKVLSYAKSLMNVDNAKSVEIFGQALEICRQLNYYDGIGTALINLGRINGQAGNYQASIQLFLQAINNFQKVGKLREICSSQLGLGTTYELIGKRDSAVHYYMTAIKVLEEKQYLPELSKAYHNLGTLYNNVKAFQKAIDYEYMALPIAKQVKDTMMLALIYSGLSLAYENDKKIQESFNAAREALSLAKVKGNNFMLARAYDRYASTSALLNRLDDAVHAGKQAIKYVLAVNDINAYFSASVSLANAYEKKGSYRQEIQVLENALQKCKDMKNILYGDDIYERLANAYYNAGDFKKSADVFAAIYLYRDSVFSKENGKMVAEFEVKYKTAQKEKELSNKQLQIAKKDLQLQISRQYTFYSLGATMVAIMVAGLVYVDFKNKNKLHVRQLKSIQQEKEIQLLQALMQGEEKERSRIAKDLHDGVAGMLAAVKMHFSSLEIDNNSLANAEGFKQANGLLDEVAIEVRKTSHNLMPEILTEYGLDEALNRYCCNINNSKKLTVQYDSWGEIDRYLESFELSVYRIVQELLNNIIKHSKATHAIVQVSQQNQLLSISIEDNGIGFQEKEKKDGMGIKNLQSRIKAMNGRMELDADTGSGVCAYLEFEISGMVKKKEFVLEL